MTRSSAASVCLVLGLALAFARAGEPDASEPPGPARQSPATNAASLTSNPAIIGLLEPLRRKHDLPAMAAAVVTGKGLLAAGVVGTRKRGADTPATLEDRWHLGSETKAMTAVLMARLVEKGRLRWDTTLAEAFPDLAPGLHPDARAITVLQLLSHRSGLKPNPDLLEYRGKDGATERLRVIRRDLTNAPAHAPGTHYEYSNLGYAVAGAIAERLLDKSWDDAMREQVFGPLGMTSTGFGGTGTPGKIDQPWGHHANGRPVPANGPSVDNPPILGPAGRVNCTIRDWSLFLADQLRGSRGEPALLSAASYTKLHTPPFAGDYALGWIAVRRDWGGGTVLTHAGDNTMNFANVWLAPGKNFAVLVCINQSGAFKASDEAIAALIEAHAKGTFGTN